MPNDGTLLGLLGNFGSVKPNLQYFQDLQTLPPTASPASGQAFTGSGLFGKSRAKRQSAEFEQARLLKNYADAQKFNQFKAETDYANQAQLSLSEKLALAEQARKDAILEKNLSEIGAAQGSMLGALPESDLNNVIPAGQTFANPADQARFLQANFGPGKSISDMAFEANPDVRKAKVFDATNLLTGHGWVGKIPEANGLHKQTQWGVQGKRQVLEPFREKITEPGQYGMPDKVTYRDNFRTINEDFWQPGSQDYIQGVRPKITAEDAKAARVGGGEGTSGESEVSKPDQSKPDAVKANFSELNFMPSNYAPKTRIKPGIGDKVLNVINTPVEGALPAVANVANKVMAAPVDYASGVNDTIARAMQELAPSKSDLEPLGNTLKKGATSFGHGLSDFRKSIIKSKGEKLSGDKTDPLALYIEALRQGIQIPFDKLHEILTGATSYLSDERYNEGSTKNNQRPIAMPAGHKKKTFSNSVNRDFRLQP